MSPVLITQIVARIVLVLQVILGIIVWTEHGDSLIPVHIAVGLLLVVDLWAAVALGLRSGAPVGLAVLAAAWSLGMPAFGLVQTNLLPGDAHVAIQVLHLIVGFVALGLIEILARKGGRRKEATG